MKRKRIRTDLMSKTEYSKAYNINRVSIDKKIANGEISVEVISGKDYIIIKPR